MYSLFNQTILPLIKKNCQRLSSTKFTCLFPNILHHLLLSSYSHDALKFLKSIYRNQSIDLQNKSMDCFNIIGTSVMKELIVRTRLYFFSVEQSYWPQFQLMFHSCTPWKHQKIGSLLIFSGGIEVEQWLKMR